MNVYACICKHVHAYASIFICVHMHFRCICMHVHAYACPCMLVNAYTCICENMHAYSCVCLLMHAYACICMHAPRVYHCWPAHAYARLCMHIRKMLGARLAAFSDDLLSSCLETPSLHHVAGGMGGVRWAADGGWLDGLRR